MKFFYNFAVFIVKGGEFMTDTEIINLYNSRNEEAITQTNIKFGRLLFSVADNILHNKSDSEETVNDTYKKAWFNIPPDMPNKLIAYLCKITRNLSLNLYNKTHAAKRYSGLEIALSELTECLPDKNGAESEMFVVTDVINSFLKSLSKEDRSIFVGRYFYCFDIKNIAKQSGILQNTVATKLHRMRKTLKEHLENEGVYL